MAEISICRKCKGADALADRISERSRQLAEQGRPVPVLVQRVKCQDICKGPVAGVEVDGTTRWFKKLRKAKSARALVKVARRDGTGPIPKRLRGHHVASRDGRRPRR